MADQHTPTDLDGVLDLVAQVRDEASLASRAGQAASLGNLADELDASIRALAAQVRAEALREAADVVHAEARWQWELHMRHSTGAQIVAQRMGVVEETIRGMADRIADTNHTIGNEQ